MSTIEWMQPLPEEQLRDLVALGELLQEGISLLHALPCLPSGQVEAMMPKLREEITHVVGIAMCDSEPIACLPCEVEERLIDARHALGLLFLALGNLPQTQGHESTPKETHRWGVTP